LNLLVVGSSQIVNQVLVFELEGLQVLKVELLKVKGQLVVLGFKVTDFISVLLLKSLKFGSLLVLKGLKSLSVL
jgi:hypothetical protein